MNEYRLTRNRPYMGTNCPGKTNRSARQGYYITAESKEAALAQMAKDFPEDVAWGSGFTCDLWREAGTPSPSTVIVPVYP